MKKCAQLSNLSNKIMIDFINPTLENNFHSTNRYNMSPVPF